jgi:hypothetical protein
MRASQLKTILWLRWRLTRNQWSRSGGLGAALAAIVAVGAVALGGASFIAGLVGAASGLGDARPEVVMGIWFGITAGFLFFWLIGLMTELQRSETIDLQRLMHLPVRLGPMFLMNYAASHLALSIILVLPAMTGLALGLAWSRGPAMLLLLPLGWSMVFMITAWTYCLRGWLASMMTNPRRRRAIIMGITLGFILVAQLPNLFFNVFGRPHPPRPQPGASPEALQLERARRQSIQQERFAKLVELQTLLPPFWLPYGAYALAEHRALPALLGTLGCAGLGGLGLYRAHRGTLRFYLGETGGLARIRTSQPGATQSAQATKAQARNWLEFRLPVVPEPAAAVALGTLRTMLRAPEVKMIWGTTFIVTVVLSAGLLSRAAPTVPATVKPFVVVLAMGLSLFMQVQFFGNQFGYDRQGFRAFVLSPVDRRWIILGKNLAIWPVGAGFGLMLIALMALWLKLSVPAAAAAVVQLATLLLLSSIAGNLLSILVPFRVEPGSMKPTKMPALAMLGMIAAQLLFPIFMLPVLLPPVFELLWRTAGGTPFVPVSLLLSLLLATLAALLYWQTLAPLGGLLQRREIKILNRVTAEQE